MRDLCYAGLGGRARDMDVETGSQQRFCIVGAGASGLAAARHFAARGIPFDCFEREADVGGIWNPASPHAVYEGTYFNSSKRMSKYLDFAMPDDYPEYMSRRQALDYLRAYARTFALEDRIAFNTAVTKAERDADGWRVTLEGEPRPRRYAGLVVANGHHWAPKMPDFPGRFDGELLHSHDVKSREQLKGRRVLVVGAGNSAVDIVSDAAIDAAAVFHSFRRSNHFVPKLIFGKPTDVVIDKLSRWPLPRAVMRALYTLGLAVLVGPHRRFGLPPPDHRLFETHPTIITNYLNLLMHGRIAVRPQVERLEGNRVHFVDGSSETVDLIVCATGYRAHFPFLDERLILTADGRPHLFLQMAHRRFDDLFVVGLVEPAEGGVWQLVDYQARLIATFIVAAARAHGSATWFRELKASATPDVGHGLRPGDSDWHKFEIQHYRYRKYIERLLRRFGAMAEAGYPSGADAPPGPAAAQEVRLAGA